VGAHKIILISIVLHIIIAINKRLLSNTNNTIIIVTTIPRRLDPLNLRFVVRNAGTAK